MRSIRSACSSLLLLSGLLGVSTFAQAADRLQVPLMDGDSINTNDYNINNHDEEGFTLFRHVDYPEKQMRYKRNDGWCDGANTRSWSVSHVARILAWEAHDRLGTE